MLRRRGFLKSAFGAALAAGLSLFSSRRAQSESTGMEGYGTGHVSQKEGHAHGSMPSHTPVAWADPKISLSPPPPLMGKQMGRIHTLNVPPLGYEMDGNVKVFTLICQPVKHFLTAFIISASPNTMIRAKDGERITFL